MKKEHNDQESARLYFILNGLFDLENDDIKKRDANIYLQHVCFGRRKADLAREFNLSPDRVRCLINNFGKRIEKKINSLNKLQKIQNIKRTGLQS